VSEDLPAAPSPVRTEPRSEKAGLVHAALCNDNFDIDGKLHRWA
jgi:hypothetical protein